MIKAEATTTEKAPAIPSELAILKPLQIWAVYHSTEDKAPYAINGSHTGKDSPQSWATGEQVEECVRRYGFQGFHVVTGAEVSKGVRLCALDLDHVIVNGTIHPQALDVINRMNSYTEISASGTGVHILYLAKPDPRMKAITVIPNPCGQGTKFEIFTGEHFCGVTGNQYGTPHTIRLCTSEPWEICQRYGITPADQEPAEATTERKPAQYDGDGYAYADKLTDEELIEKALTTNADFRNLWAGDAGADHSTADMALCARLAFWTNGDTQRIDSLFRQSGLMREKWDRRTAGSTYGQITINKVLEGFTPSLPKAKQDLTQEPVQDLTLEPKAEEKKPLPDYSMFAYIRDAFMDDIATYKEGKARRTGYPAIDAKLKGLFPGLYTLSASPGAGKSALVFNIAQNLAKTEEHVLYFSLEMSPFEMVSRAISRESVQDNGINPRTALTALKVMTDKEPAQTWETIKRMETMSRHLHLVPAELDMHVDRIIEILDAFTEKYKAVPVAVVDYLQIIQPKDLRMTDMESISYTVRRLKQWQMKNNAVVFVISSIPRSSYYSTGGMDAGKGSGTIEFTSNVVLNLQYEALENAKGNDDAKRAILKEAQQQNPRKLTLSCSKARNGQSGWTVNLDFYPECNYFIAS